MATSKVKGYETREEKVTEIHLHPMWEKVLQNSLPFSLS